MLVRNSLNDAIIIKLFKVFAWKEISYKEKSHPCGGKKLIKVWCRKGLTLNPYKIQPIILIILKK